MTAATPTKRTAADRLAELHDELVAAQEAEAAAMEAVDAWRAAAAADPSKDTRGNLNKAQRALAKRQEETGSIMALIPHAERLVKSERQAEQAALMAELNIDARRIEVEAGRVRARLLERVEAFIADIEPIVEDLADIAERGKAHDDRVPRGLPYGSYLYEAHVGAIPSIDPLRDAAARLEAEARKAQAEWETYVPAKLRRDAGLDVPEPPAPTSIVELGWMQPAEEVR